MKKSRTAALAMACFLAAVPAAPAVELLSNGDFELPANGNPATGWNDWSWNSGWANTEVAAWGSGSWQISVGAPGDGGGGFYQEVAGAPGVEYTLSVDSGADAWWLPSGRMEMFFLNSTNGTISSASQLTVDPSVYGETNYDIAHPWSNYTLVATAPAGTVKVKVEFSCNESLATPGNASGSVGFDNASLTAPIDPPVIGNLHPNGSLLLTATNELSFTASSIVGIDVSGIQVLLNGVDVSGSLAVGGSATNRSVSYGALESNTVYTVAITVTDTIGISAIASATFDTFSPVLVWEAEDYNYSAGDYINDPTPSDVPAAGSYFGLSGTDGVDYHDYSANGTQAYRSSDAMAAEVVGDAARQKFLDAGASDYNVGWFDGAGFPAVSANAGIDDHDAGEWLNYTRDFPPGTYHLYARVANGNAGTATIPLSRVTSDPTSPGQTTTELGAFRFPGMGWAAYAYVPLTDEFGNRVKVTFAGTDTLRVTAGSGGNLNFFMLVPVDDSQPTITGVYPDGSTLLQGVNELTFTAGSATSSIAQSNVVVTLNGADASDSLSFTGNAGSWNVHCPLELRVTNYIATIAVTDNAGKSHSVTLYFDTFDAASFVVEAEDFDYEGGLFIDDPAITSTNAANSYFDHPLAGLRIGSALVDFYVGDNPELDLNVGAWRYRALDDIRTDICSDTPMQRLLDAQATNDLAFNYNVSYMRSNTWLNYTRTYPAGDYNVYGRLSSDSDYAVRFDEVNGATTLLGHFLVHGRGFGFYDWVPLVDTNGALATVTLDGVTTLRLTTPEGEVNLNSYLFVPAVVPPEELMWDYSGGILTLSWDSTAFRLQAQTNAPGTGLTNGWGDYPGGEISPVAVPVDSGTRAVFFRLTD